MERVVETEKHLKPLSSSTNHWANKVKHTQAQTGFRLMVKDGYV